MYQVATERNGAQASPTSRLAAEVVHADALDEAQVVQRQHVRAQQVEDEEHLGRPPPDAADGHELGDDGLVVHALPLRGVHLAVAEVAGQVEQVLALARREAGLAQARALHRQHLGRLQPRDGAAHGERKPLPHALRRLHADLLADDAARQRGEGVAAALQAGLAELRDQLLHHPVALGQVLAGLFPVRG
jgi:hypothetical protein